MRPEQIQRCKKCNLPSNYPHITFNDNGECNYCVENQQKHSYLGMEELKKDIDRILSQSSPNRKYDCAVGVSGGRDSSYLLYFAKEVLGLNVLAISLDHDFITPFAKQNIKVLVKRLGVDIHYIKNDILNIASRKCVQSWAKKPDVAMCASFCTGCRYGISKMIPQYVMGQKIPILMTGHSINEAKTNYRIELLCDNKKSSKANLFIGYGKRLLKNPSYFRSIKTLYYQFLDFLAVKGRKGKTNLSIIRPFYYIEWKEDTVVPKILELGWKYDDKEFKSTWRADCYIGVLRQFFYKQELGFNDLDAYYAHLLRNKEISMSEAMERIQFENENNEDLVRSILRDFYDVDYDIVKKKMNKWANYGC